MCYIKKLTLTLIIMGITGLSSCDANIIIIIIVVAIVIISYK